jgi:hypothetical protein
MKYRCEAGQDLSAAKRTMQPFLKSITLMDSIAD